MSRFFKGIFGKKGSRDDADVMPDNSHRRQLSLRSRRGERTTRFEDESDYIPATAPYHTVTQPRAYRGPRSCPGGPMDEEIGRRGHVIMNRSFDAEKEQRRHERERRRNRDVGTLDFHHTSEYGSGDPSPTTNVYYMNGHHGPIVYRADFDSETDEAELQEDRMNILIQKLTETRTRYQRQKDELKSMRGKYEQCKIANHQLKQDLERYRETENVLLNSNKRLEAENKRLQNEIRYLKQQQASLTLQGPASFSSPFHQPSPFMSATGYHERPFGSSHRHGIQYTNLPTTMPHMLNMSANTPTPSTSAFGGSIAHGAGEQLIHPNDSLLTQPAPLASQESSFQAPSLQLNLEVEDEMKNFRSEQQHTRLSVETPRSNTVAPTNHISSSTMGFEIPALRDEGYSTTATDEVKEGQNNTLLGTLRRTASDPVVSPPRNLKNTKL